MEQENSETKREWKDLRRSNAISQFTDTTINSAALFTNIEVVSFLCATAG
jgi:hypothetical protein